MPTKIPREFFIEDSWGSDWAELKVKMVFTPNFKMYYKAVIKTIWKMKKKSRNR